MNKALKYYFTISAIILLSITLRYLAYLYDKPNPNQPLTEVYEEEPLLLSAKLRAKENQDTLFKYFPKYSQNTFVKFPTDTNKTLTEYEWGKLLALNKKAMIVQKHQSDSVLTLPIKNLQDWLIEIENNKVKGGYTTQALFILEAKINKNTEKKLDSILGHFTDPLY